jgi:phage/plasmid-like protein (TIGR03299 family)
MAHELTRKPNGSYEFAYTGSAPWHQLGNYQAEVMTKEQLMTAAGLDFLVIPEAIHRPTGEVIEGFVNNTRSDTGESLGVVSNGYRLIQVGDCLQFVDTLINTAGAKYHTGGSIRRGRHIFAAAKLPTSHMVVPDDVVDHYLLMVNAYDGSMGLHLRWTDIRVVCANTETAALGQNANYQYTVHHVGDINAQLQQARQALGMATKYFEVANQTYKAMAAVDINQLSIEKFLNGFLPFTAVGDKATSKSAQVEDQGILKARSRIQQLVEIGVGTEIPGVKGSVWGLYNAATEWIDHVRTAKKDGEMRLGAAEAAVIGVGQGLRNLAMKSALALLS